MDLPMSKARLGLHDAIVIFFIVAHIFLPLPGSIKTLSYFMLVAFLGIWLVGKHTIVYRKGIFIALIVIVFWSGIGCFYTNQMSAAFRFVFRWFVVLMVLAYAINSKVVSKQLCKVVIALGLVCVVATILQIIFPSIMESVSKVILTEEAFRNYKTSFIYFNSYYGICSTSYENALYIANAVIWFLIRFTNAKSKRIVDLGGIIVSTIALIATQKRSILICVAFCMLLYITYVVFSRNVKKSIKVMFLVGMVVFFFVGTWYISTTEVGRTTVNRLFVDIDDMNFSHRDVMFANIWESSQDSLWFGHGTATSYNIYDIGVHNIYLQLLYENGIIGVICFLIMFWVNIAYTYKRIKVSSEKEPYLISFFCQIIFIIYGLSGNDIFYSNTILLYALYISITYCHSSEDIGNVKEHMYNDISSS